jgi:hypothetical protein
MVGGSISFGSWTLWVVYIAFASLDVCLIKPGDLGKERGIIAHAGAGPITRFIDEKGAL